ncbi:MAG: leucine--tRNA ligase [bacterium]|nr:leucine--tRNA ligase [bacterium]
MANDYQHQIIEKKWQKKWAEEKLYRTQDKSDKPKYYLLDMFPYPSGAGLHVGHPKGYIATDVLARQKMMQGYNVLHPMGWDGFGLPAENFALKNKVHPAQSTAQNIAVFKQQLEILGFTYDWEREVNTTDPKFYHWTQWIFARMYESYYDEKLDKAAPIAKLIEDKFGHKSYQDLSIEQKKFIDAQRLAFEDFAPINWCPSCKTGLANEDLEDGRFCERCGSLVEKKPLRQWNLRITKYAERLLRDLQDLDWEPSIKLMQKNWIGKSEGARVRFFREAEKSSQTEFFDVFTTRVETIFGVTYLAIAPELVTKEVLAQIPSSERAVVEQYLAAAQQKSLIDRADETKEKTGVLLAGIAAFNPVNGKPVPVFVADYVLSDYGTGVVMGVPAHDERDAAFAQKMDLPILPVVDDQGLLINSGSYNGLTIAQGREKILSDLVSGNYAEKKTIYKLRDWVFSRQRYWGEPIPIIHCKNCGNILVPDKELPLKLPEVAHYEPSGTGESPLAKISAWVETTCPICGGPAQRETNTMPQWAGSSWYYLRYIDPHNDETLIDPEKERSFMPVDFYVGGAEHATRHLIYARFYHKFLQDIGVVSTSEPFKKLQHVGLILAEDGRKMSKRWGNVINPDEIVAQYGADSLRVYEMFMGPFEQPTAWNTQGVAGVHKFLRKVWALQEKVTSDLQEAPLYLPLLQQTIQKVTDDLEGFKLNTAVSALMILVNKMQEAQMVALTDYEKLLQLLAPFAPHLTEELWQHFGHQQSIFLSVWPQADLRLLESQAVILPIQVNGKLRAQIELQPAELTDENLIWQKVLAQEKIQHYLENKEIVKKIYIPSKIINLVVK